MEMVTITAEFENGTTDYTVPAECRYFASAQLIEMGAVAIRLGNVFVKSEELV